MRQSRTLATHLAREIIQYATLAFVAIITVLVSQNVLRRLDDLVGTGFTAGDFWAVLACLFPMLASYAVPVSFLFGALLAIRRQASDLEIEAMQACGISARSLLVPTLALGVVVTLLCGYLMGSVEHSARRELIRIFKTVAARGGLLESGVFRQFGDRLIYVEHHDREDRLHGIMIADRASADHPFLVFAEQGRLTFDPDAEVIRIELDDGDLHVEPSREEPDGYQRISFDRFRYSLDVSAIVAGAAHAVRPKQMTMGELNRTLGEAANGALPRILDERNPRAYAVEIHRRFALPLAPVLFALVAVPFGVLGGPGRRAFGLLIGVGVAFAYYTLLSVGQMAALEGALPPAAALWLPNLGFAALALELLRRTDRGPSA